MITIIPLKSDNWNKIVSSFKEYDIYYLQNYCKAFQIHGDGEPLLFYYKSEHLRGMNVSMKRDISKFMPFNKIIPTNTYFDIVSPYGYGGFIFEGDINDKELSKFRASYYEALNNENIISEFVRYHPLLKNAEPMRTISTVIDLGQTISINLDSEQLIWDNLTSKNRNMIRKAEKSGVKIQHGKDWSLFIDFIGIYNETMFKDNATPYYYFAEDFYRSIYRDLYREFEIFYATLDDKIIAMSIIIYTNKKMHYHFSGSLIEYRHFAPSNLLLYKAALWGHKNRFNTFHLGGGLGSGEDSLFKFKKAFNRNSENQFSIGKNIINKNIYYELINKRKVSDPLFDSDSKFFPLYRS